MAELPAWPTPDRAGVAWVYCGRCGTPMGWTRRGSGFDRQTGEPVRIYAWSCPRWVENGAKHDRLESTMQQREIPA